MSKIAIIGGNRECFELVPFFYAEKDMDLIYVTHNHTSDPSEIGIPTLSDFKELTGVKDLELVIDVSNDPEVEQFLNKNLNQDIEVLKKPGSRLVCRLLEERRRVQEETEKNLQSHKEIYKLGMDLNTAMNVEDMSNAIIDCAVKLTNTPAGSLVVYNAGRNTMRLAAIKGFSDKFSQVKEWPVRKGGLTDYLMHQKEPVVIPDVTKESAFDNPVMREEGVRSLMAVALVADDNNGGVQGILYVDDFAPRDFSEEEITELALLANQAAFGLQKVHLLDALSQTKDYMEAILKNTPDMIITTDKNTNIVEFNPGAESMLGYSKQEVIGTTVERFYPNNAERREVMKKVNTLGKVTNYETKLITKTGKLLDISLSLSQLKDRDGHIIGTVGLSKDITRQKKLEEDLKRSNTELGHKIEEVKKIDQMKSDFLSTVSHELRTPLTSIIGFSKMILRRFEKDIITVLPPGETKALKSGGKIKENLEIVVSEGNRLSRLINNLLDLAKIEAGKIEWNITRCSLVEICQSAMYAVKSLADEKHLELKIEAAPDLPDINGDHDRIIQVVTNLLSNAIKFTDDGSVTCVLKRIPNSIEMRVIDTGIGLKPDDVPKVFEKFKQVGDTLTNRPKGTGLGLPICKEIIEAHNGKIWAESEYGKGSQFVFTLAAAKAVKAVKVERSAILQEVKDKIYQQVQNVEKGQTVLVVDDEDNIRRLLHQELDEAGYTVIEAVDGSEALNKARNEQPDLIILDILMPGIDGFDVMTILKNDLKTSNIPILIFSITEDREKVYHMGADAYITKSAGPEQLLKTISSLIAIPKNKKRKVLIIEHDKAIIQVIKETLEVKGYEVFAANDIHNGIAKAQTELPNIIIIDGTFSQQNDGEILKTLKYDQSTADANIIVLTSDAEQNIQMTESK